MDWLSLGIVIGCAVMFVIALVWRQYRMRMKADEEARMRAQAVIDEVAAKAKKESAGVKKGSTEAKKQGVKKGEKRKEKD